MATERPSRDPAERLFLRPSATGVKAVLWIVGGCAALFFAVLGFGLAIFARVDTLAMHAMTTVPTIMGIAALTAGVTLARTPSQVAVGPAGITVEGRQESRRHSWDRIGWATVGTSGMSQRKQLVIYDPEGRTLVKLSDAFNDFDHLVELVQRHVAQRGDDTPQRLQSSKSRRSALITGGIGVIMLGVAGANVWIAREEQRSAKLLAEAAIPGEARIVRRFLAPNGVTPRLEYEVTGADGRTAMRNAEVERALWDGLEGAETVPVFYVPDEPSISRLLAGEPEEDDPTKSPAVMYALSGAVALISLLGLVAAVLQWRGWDIDLDSKTGKISIKRFGTGR